MVSFNFSGCIAIPPITQSSLPNGLVIFIILLKISSLNQNVVQFHIQLLIGRGRKSKNFGYQCSNAISPKRVTAPYSMTSMVLALKNLQGLTTIISSLNLKLVQFHFNLSFNNLTPYMQCFKQNNNFRFNFFLIE